MKHEENTSHDCIYTMMKFYPKKHAIIIMSGFGWTVFIHNHKWKTVGFSPIQPYLINNLFFIFFHWSAVNVCIIMSPTFDRIFKKEKMKKMPNVKYVKNPGVAMSNWISSKWCSKNVSNFVQMSCKRMRIFRIFPCNFQSLLVGSLGSVCTRRLISKWRSVVRNLS